MSSPGPRASSSPPPLPQLPPSPPDEPRQVVHLPLQVLAVAHATEVEELGACMQEGEDRHHSRACSRLQPSPPRLGRGGPARGPGAGQCNMMQQAHPGRSRSRSGASAPFLSSSEPWCPCAGAQRCDPLNLCHPQFSTCPRKPWCSPRWLRDSMILGRARACPQLA